MLDPARRITRTKTWRSETRESFSREINLGRKKFCFNNAKYAETRSSSIPFTFSLSLPLSILPYLSLSYPDLAAILSAFPSLTTIDSVLSRAEDFALNARAHARAAPKKIHLQEKSMRGRSTCPCPTELEIRRRESVFRLGAA